MSLLPFLLHGTTLALAWFLILNLAATAIVAIVAARLTTRVRTAAPGVWLALRLGPAILSIGFVVGVFLPSYWRYEPREFVEGFDVTMSALAMMGLAVIAAGVARGATAWRRAARRTEQWLRTARPLALPGASMPAFAIETDAPVMALVGIVRSRLLIARPVLAALNDEELRAGVAHELGHSRSWDNLKRLAMRAAPDCLAVTSAAGAIERHWAAASEQVADRMAGDEGSARCALASALVKVARLVPPPISTAEPISALIDGGDVTSRVRRLLQDVPAAAGPRRGRWLALAIPAAALAAGYAPLLRVVHGVTEVLVNGLP